MARSERVATNLTPENKRDLQIHAMRKDITEAELLRQLIQEFLEEEEIPDEVREYFEGELSEGNLNRATAD